LAFSAVFQKKQLLVDIIIKFEEVAANLFERYASLQWNSI